MCLAHRVQRTLQGLEETSRPTWIEEPASAVPAISASGGRKGLNEGDRADALLEAFRLLENLLHVIGGEVLRGPPRAQQDAGASDDETDRLASEVFGSYERTLASQCAMSFSSVSVAYGIAFASCVGAAIDASCSLLNCRGGLGPAGDSITTSGSDICADTRSLSLTATPEAGLARRGPGTDPLGTEGGVFPMDDDNESRGLKRKMATARRDNDGQEHRSGAVAAASCLGSVLAMAASSSLVDWLLDLYSRCGDGGGGGGGSNSGDEEMSEGAHDDHPDGVSLRGEPRSLAGVLQAGTSLGRPLGLSDETSDPWSETRELLVEVLESLIFAQGWTNALASYDSDRPLAGRADGVTDPTALGARDEAVDGEAGSSSLSKTTRVLLSSWAAAGSGRESSLDAHVIALLGTEADDGNLCKLVVRGDSESAESPAARAAA